MASKEKSVIPVKHGFPNPCYGQALDLIRNVSAYRQLASRVRAEAAKLRANGGDIDMAQLFKQCADVGVKGDLRKLFDDHVKVPKEKPVLGPPPPTSELYGRFGRGVAIVDVGSGNCMKLVRSSGTLNICAVDPDLINQAKLVLNPFKMALSTFLLQNPDFSERIFTSFMALPQIPTVEWLPIVECDGMHMIPDHQMLLKNNIAVVREDGKIRVRTGVKNYDDYNVELPGVVVEPGYMLSPTFKKRQLTIELSADVTVQSYTPEIDARPAGFYDLNFSDLGPKFDGVAHELECSEGQAYLVDRGGHQRMGIVPVDFHFCLHLEELEKCFILLRIVSWRGIVPPHHGDVMRLFCERVVIDIGEKPVLPSPRWNGRSFRDGPLLQWERGGVLKSFRPPTDGVVSREGGFDHYCKYMWTVDITESRISGVARILEDNGYLLRVEGNFWGGINECALTRDGSIVELKPLKPRVDKTRETTDDTILFLVDRPTLCETELLTGSSVMV